MQHHTSDHIPACEDRLSNPSHVDVDTVHELIANAVAAERRRTRKIVARTLAVALLAAGAMWGSTAVASGHHCANGLICFAGNQPAVADDVNQNFKTLKDWLVQKVGAAGTADVEVNGTLTVTGNNTIESDGARLTLGSGQTDGYYGMLYDRDIWGGSGDVAWTKYYRRGTSGEAASLQVGINNDSDDHLEFYQGGTVRMWLGNYEVRVDDNLSVRDGIYTEGRLTTDGRIIQTIGAGNGVIWGSKISKTCPQDQYMCGLDLWDEGNQGGGDDTGVSEIHIKCCTIGR